MADEADHAQELEQLALEQALARRLPTAAGLVPNGFCHNCHEPLKPVKTKEGLKHIRRFCDDSCRDDFEARSRAQQQRL